MDTDLAFCLGQFIDDQVEVIDDRLNEIKKEANDRCRKIEQEEVDFNQRKSPPKNQGSHHEDKALVDQFIQDLRETVTASNTSVIIDDETYIDTLRAELSTKVGACANYLNRIRNLAQPIPNTGKFVETCNEAIADFRRSQEFADNFKNLIVVLKESESTNIVQNVQKWWREAYGATVTAINQRNQKINSAITENNFAVLSQTSRIIDNSKKLIAARKIVPVPSKKPDIIRQFIQQLLSIDEENRVKINADDLFERLNISDTERAIDYAVTWLKKRDEIRNRKEENPFEVRLEEAKAEYGRKRIAQEAKKLALAALLCRLAVGSSNSEQFDQQLNKTIKNQMQNNEESLAVISGDIKEPEAQELPIIIQLALDGTDIDQWAANKGGIQERFGAALCQAFLIPDKCIRIDRIERDKANIFLYVLPPYGKVVVDSLNGTAPDAAARMKAVRKCCVDLNAHVESITLGEFGLKVEDKLMDPRWNKKYGCSRGESGEEHFWSTPIDQGGKPYHCPSGWKRFGVKVAEDGEDFKARWGNWYMAYHGTRGENASKILTSGLRVSTNGCFYGDGVPRVYVSPSIEYCAHPRYAFPWKKTKKNGEELWYQLVFQCRVNPASVAKIGPETLIHDQSEKSVKIDPNFDNGELEWIILGKMDEQFIKNDIICYGLMMRLSSVDPVLLTPSAWWKQSLHADIYKQKQ